jgi:hypothetical protein
MANSGRKHTGRSGDTNKSKTTSRAKPGGNGIRESGGKLDSVSDAPESGEPREQGRSRGRRIES